MGPFAVGFQTSWEFDHTRRYNTTFDDKTTYAAGKAPRPILVNRWYPVNAVGDAKRMPHRAYFDIRSDDPQLAKFSVKMAEYNRAVLAKEVMGKPAADLTDREKRLLDEFLDTPTARIQNAPPARGSFPLVIYHAGAGSSFEDNSVLCEFLASHGFVVLGSAFQREDGSSLTTDGVDGSGRDLGFLIAHARQVPGVDWGHVGVVGHSLGAQAALLYRSQAGCSIDAVVCLDTTQDYRGVSDPTWEYLTTPVAKNRKHVSGALLMAAGSYAFFELADSLDHARRYYLTLKGLDHNDYISQGGISRERLVQLHRDDAGRNAEARAKEEAELIRVREEYRSLCEYVLRFLEAELKGDAGAKTFLEKQYRDTKLGGDDPHVEHVAAGRSGPDPYREVSNLPPTPRQVRPFLGKHGADRTIAVFQRFRQGAPDAPIFHRNFELFLVSDLLDRGKTKEALAFSDYFRKSELDCVKVFLSLGDSFKGMGRPDRAADFYKRVVLLEPFNGAAAAKLKTVQQQKTKDP
jgi:pimeloyl-ACP methyl ester carboxylesterase